MSSVLYDPNPVIKSFFQSFFTDLYKHGVEEMLKGELDENLGYEKHSKDGDLFRIIFTGIKTLKCPFGHIALLFFYQPWRNTVCYI